MTLLFIILSEYKSQRASAKNTMQLKERIYQSTQLNKVESNDIKYK